MNGFLLMPTQALFLKHTNYLKWFMKYFKACSLPLHFMLLVFFSSELGLSLTSFSLWKEPCPLASSVGICWSPGLKNYFFCLTDSQFSFRSSLESQLRSFFYSRFGLQITSHFHYYSTYHNLLSLPVKLSIFPSRL